MYNLRLQDELNYLRLYSMTRLSALCSDSLTRSWSVDKHGKSGRIVLSLADTITASGPQVRTLFNVTFTSVALSEKALSCTISCNRRETSDTVFL